MAIKVSGNTVIADDRTVIVAAANTGNRPTPQAGMIRYNTDTNKFEFYSTNWQGISGDVIARPTVTVTDTWSADVTNQIVTSAFSSTPVDAHTATTWRVIRVSDGALVFSSNNNTSNLTNIGVPGNTLDRLETYRAEAIHFGDVIEASSPIGNTQFTTLELFAPVNTLPADGATGLGDSSLGAANSETFRIAFNLPVSYTVQNTWFEIAANDNFQTLAKEVSGQGANNVSIVLADLIVSKEYYFRAKYSSNNTNSIYSTTTSFITASSLAPTGEDLYTTVGTFSWTAPPGVTSVSVLAVGAGGEGSGGGSGGGLGYKNNYTVTPGSSYTVVVNHSDSGDTYFVSPAVVAGQAGQNSYNAQNQTDPGGTFVGDGGGNGGDTFRRADSGGGGAAGYSGNGGTGGNPGTDSGNGGSGGGGVGLFGEGASGTPGGATGGGGGGGGGNTGGRGGQGTGGSGGEDGHTDGNGQGGDYGGGGTWNGVAGDAAVRIVYPGSSRQFPSTDVGA